MSPAPARVLRSTAVLVLAAGVGVPTADAGPTARTSAVVTACVAKKTGAMRLRQKGKKCTRRERKLKLYAAPGEVGPRGEPGPAGPPGVPGDPGAAGPNGSPDTGQDILGKLLGVDGAGSGLDADLFGGLATSAFQRRGASTACPAGEYVSSLAATGDVVCAADANTTYTAGTGLSLTAGQFAVNPAYVKATCPSVANFTDNTVVWTGTVCMVKGIDNFDTGWGQYMNDCATGFYGPRGRLPTYAELIAAAKQGLISLVIGEHTADTAGDDNVIYINSVDTNNADGVRASNTVSGTAGRCVFAPRQAQLGNP